MVTAALSLIYHIKRGDIIDYNLICIDMDGTLLNKQHRITEVSKEALKNAGDMGIHIVISTVRMYADGKYYSDLLEVKFPVIASNGAIIKDKNRLYN